MSFLSFFFFLSSLRFWKISSLRWRKKREEMDHRNDMRLQMVGIFLLQTESKVIPQIWWCRQDDIQGCYDITDRSVNRMQICPGRVNGRFMVGMSPDWSEDRCPVQNGDSNALVAFPGFILKTEGTMRYPYENKHTFPRTCDIKVSMFSREFSNFQGDAQLEAKGELQIDSEGFLVDRRTITLKG